MAKYVMECPNCKKFVEASTGGFFGIGRTKKVVCSCGYEIDVKAEKLTSKICSHCGNEVVFDQSKGESALCPVCHNKINTIADATALTQISCPFCSCKIMASKNSSFYTCPLCETRINVQEQIAKEKIRSQGLASVIKYEGGNNIFVFKHPIEDFNCGSQLIVHESQEALFFKDGKALDLFPAGRYTLTTQNLPVLQNLYKLPVGENQVFHSEIYFINLVTQMGLKWGTDSKVRLFDPASGLFLEIGACGNFSLRVCDSRKLILKLVGTTSSFKQEDINGDGEFGTTAVIAKFKALIINRVKSNLASLIKTNNIDILEIDSKLDVLSERLKDVINETLEEYGLTMPEFFITTVLTPDEDPNFKRLKQQFADKTLKVREENIKKAEAEAAQVRKIIEAQTDNEILKMKAYAEAEAYKAKAYAEAEEMRMKGYTYQQETARKVGLESMKNGLTGSGGSSMGSAFGDIAGLGVQLGAMGSVINMTKNTISPALDFASQGFGQVNGQKLNNNQNSIFSWNCSCGTNGITSNFCPNCGKSKIENNKWNCVCGMMDISSNFCPNCGKPKLIPNFNFDLKSNQMSNTKQSVDEFQNDFSKTNKDSKNDENIKEDYKNNEHLEENKIEPLKNNNVEKKEK